MPAEYVKIVRGIWRDPDLRAAQLTADQMCLLMYWFTSPHGNMTGVYWCPLPYVEAETRIARADVESWTRDVLAPYVVYDARTEEVFVRSSARHQIGAHLSAGDKRLPAICKALAGVHSTMLVSLFLTEYVDWPIADDTLRARAAESVPSPSGDSSVIPLRRVTEASQAAMRGDAAELVRTHLWLGKTPPKPLAAAKRAKWSMSNELSIWAQLAKSYGAEDVNRAIPHIRAQLGAAGNEPLSLLYVNAADKREHIMRAIGAGRKARGPRDETGGSDIGDVLRGLDV